MRSDILSLNSGGTYGETNGLRACEAMKRRRGETEVLRGADDPVNDGGGGSGHGAAEPDCGAQVSGGGRLPLKGRPGGRPRFIMINIIGWPKGVTACVQAHNPCA